MKFKDILVLVDDSPNCTARIDLAMNLARKNKSHLTGLYVIAQAHYDPQQEGINQKVAAIEAEITRKAVAAGILFEWRYVVWPITGASMAEIVNLYAYHKDLVIVGQSAQGRNAGSVPSDLPERVVKGSGRPVLIVPYAGTFNKVGEQVMIAWNSGRESVRALSDAMPFLVQAEKVNVLAVSSRGIQDNSADNDFGDISTHLSLYGIKAHIKQFAAGEHPIGDVLLNTAWEEGCDLLVMGAYAYTKRGTLALGPVARHILDHMTMPVLMSH